MKNYGVIRAEKSSVDGFTTDAGIKLRRYINPCLRPILKQFTKRNITVERYPDLPKDENYIFVSTHYYDEDIISALATIDRNAYILLGTTDQIEHNPQMYAAWLNGMVYVNRLDKQSRSDSVKKMERVLNAGSSVLLYPEGGWNNTENLLVQKLFSGPYILAKSTNKKVVPICNFHEYGKDDIFISVGDPIDLTQYDKKEALSVLRDSLATMMYESIEKHSTPIVRNELEGDIHLNHMEERRKEYLRVNWTTDVWDEELTIYKDRDCVDEQDVYSCFDNIDITKENASLVAPILVKRQEHKKYDFKQYMKNNWNKK